MDNAEKTIRRIHELVSRQSEIEALKRVVSHAEQEINRLEQEVSELSAKYDLD